MYLERGIKTHKDTHWGKMVMWRQREKREWWRSYSEGMPRIAGKHQKAGRDKGGFDPGAFQGARALQHFDFRHSASEAVRVETSIVLSNSVCGNLLCQPQETNISGLGMLSLGIDTPHENHKSPGQTIRDTHHTHPQSQLSCQAQPGTTAPCPSWRGRLWVKVTLEADTSSLDMTCLTNPFYNSWSTKLWEK